MRIKIIRQVQGADGAPLEPGTIFDTENDADAQALIDVGDAIAYSEEVEAADAAADQARLEAEKTALQAELAAVEAQKACGDKPQEKAFMKGILGKALKTAVETKSATVVSDFGGVTATPVLGVIASESELYKLVRHIPIQGSALRVIYSKPVSGESPEVGIIGEKQTADTAIPKDAYTRLVAKWMATVSVPNEYLEDIEAMEAFVQDELQGELNDVLDNSILYGADPTNGFKGIYESDQAVEVECVDPAAPTKAELELVMAAVLAKVHKNAVWVMSSNSWAACQAALLDEKNVGGQLIVSGKDKMLYQFPVIVTDVAGDHIFFGDFSHYVLGETRGITVEVDKSAEFLSDATSFKISVRAAGGPACSLRTVTGGAVKSAIAYTVATAPSGT